MVKGIKVKRGLLYTNVTLNCAFFALKKSSAT